MACPADSPDSRFFGIMCKARTGILSRKAAFLLQLLKGGNRVAEVRYHDAAAHNQGYVEGVNNFSLGEAFFGTLLKVIVDTVVAAKHSRSHKPEQLLGFAVEGAVAVGVGIEIEKAFDPEMIEIHDLFIHALALSTEVVEFAHVAGMNRFEDG